MITEFRLTDSNERVLLNCKEHCVVVMVGTREAFTFDATGRLLYAAADGQLLKRGLDNSVLRIDRGHDVLTERLALPHLERAYREIARVVRHAPPEAREALGPAVRCGTERLSEDARRFARIYGTVPVLPPDQYNAVYLQATVGCAYNRCAFCTFYRDRRFRARSLQEFDVHLREVLDLLGADVVRRASIFLGDANALDVPTAELCAMLRLAGAALPGRPFHAFVDASIHRDKSVEELRELKGLGLKRVTLGIETGHLELYRKLRKPATLEGVAASVRQLKEAGLAVGVTVLVGIGGREYAGPHVRDTSSRLLTFGLGAGDCVYLSPLSIDSGSDYAEWARATGDRTMDEEGLRRQLEAFRGTLAPSLGPRGVRIAAYDISRFVY